VKLSGWGRYPVIEARACAVEDDAGLRSCLASGAPTIAYGLGRSYGDSALSHSVLMMRRMAKYLAFDPAQGLLTCEAGVSLDEIVRTFLPRGWFLRITPGTRFITVGGAIASDVHGKNHHKEGCFSSCVRELELMLPDGRVLTCSAGQNGELFRATCGGMGLTGVILRATIALLPVRSGMIEQTVIKAASLEHVFELFERHADAHILRGLDRLPCRRGLHGPLPAHDRRARAGWTARAPGRLQGRASRSTFPAGC
jgi:decaprenylphospho-beta-D-ribofuranose 2-oxidase